MGKQQNTRGMSEKQEYALHKILSSLPDDCREPFREVAEYAISLGYVPKLNAKETYADFNSTKTKRIILKIDAAATPPRLAMQFCPMPAYSGIFYDAIVERVGILVQMGHTPRCWGCGKCDGTEGHTYVLSDGKTGFLCGRGVMTLPSFCAENVSEVKAALKAQDDYLLGSIKA